MLTKKIAIAAGALTLAAGGVAAAAGSPPEQADDGLTTAEAKVGVELPASKDAHPGGLEEEALDEATDEAEEAEASEGAELTDDDGTTEDLTEGGPTDNHGAEVSAVARSDEHEGRAHGEAVSAVARDNHGAEVSAEARGEVGGGDDADEGAAEAEQAAGAAGAKGRR